MVNKKGWSWKSNFFTNPSQLFNFFHTDTRYESISVFTASVGALSKVKAVECKTNGGHCHHWFPVTHKKGKSKNLNVKSGKQQPQIFFGGRHLRSHIANFPVWSNCVWFGKIFRTLWLRSILCTVHAHTLLPFNFASAAVVTLTKNFPDQNAKLIFSWKHSLTGELS